jgi:hypothetical protein
MVQYVDNQTAQAGQVRKFVLVHFVPAEAADRFLVSIDLVEHGVAEHGLIRGRRGPRVTRKLVLATMDDEEARHVAESIARQAGTPYICIDRDPWLPVQVAHPVHDAAD